MFSAFVFVSKYILLHSKHDGFLCFCNILKHLKKRLFKYLSTIALLFFPLMMAEQREERQQFHALGDHFLVCFSVAVTPRIFLRRAEAS